MEKVASVEAFLCGIGCFVSGPDFSSCVRMAVLARDSSVYASKTYVLATDDGGNVVRRLRLGLLQRLLQRLAFV